MNPHKNLNQYNYIQWTSDNGLPDNAIIYITQAKDGYIWFASYGGITRFNGTDFYTFNSYNTPVLTNNSFTHVYEDNEGIIWACSSGNGIATVKNDQVQVYTTDSGLSSNFAEEVVQDKDGIIWVATSKGLVYRKNNEFTNSEVPEPLTTLPLKSIDCDEKNHLWVATVDNGVYEIFKGKIVNHYTIENGLLSNKMDYVSTKNNHVWIGTDSGLNTIVDGRVAGTTVSDGLPNKMITHSYFDDNGLLWVGSYEGFCRIGLDGYQYLSPSHPMYGRDITSMVEDSEGNLWVSTYRAGLFKFWEGKFTNYSDYELDKEQPYTVHTVFQKNDRELVLVTEEEVVELNIENNEISKIDLGLKSSSQRFKTGILDSQGRYWFGTKNGVIRHENGKSEWINVDNGLVNDNIRVIYEDTEGAIWVGTFSGITRISKDGSEMTNFTSKNGLSHNYVMSIMEDSEHNIWVGTRTGLNLFKDGKFTVVNAKSGLAGDFVFKTFEDKDNVIWVGGNAGLSRYKDGKFKKITVVDGLVSNTIFQILEDDIGYLWFTTNQRNISVFKVLKSELNDFFDGKIKKVNSIEYTRTDGIVATSATSSGTSLKSNDGKLWFATHRGVESIDPVNININNRILPVVVESFDVNDTPINIHEKVIVPPGRQRINIRFAGLSYIASEHIKFKYQLVGYDEDWVLAGDKHETSYTNLGHGNYEFRVIAANNDGVWNNEGAIIAFTVEPAYYETYWFYALATIVLIVIIWAIYELRLRSLTHARKELEVLVSQRTSEIEDQKEEIETQRGQIEKQHNELKQVNTQLEDIVEQRTSELKQTYGELLNVNKELDTFIYRAVHDIRGPIARLQGLSHLIQKQTNDKDILNLTSMLNRTAEDMNDIFYRLINIVRIKTSDLDHAEMNVLDVVQNVLSHFELDSSHHNHEIIVAIDPNITLNSNKETVESILFQLVENAIKFRKDREQAHVEIGAIKNEKSQVVITVADKGRGIDLALADKIFEMFFIGNDFSNGTGLGLYTARTAAKVLNSEVNMLTNAKIDSVTTFEIKLTNYAIEVE